MKFAVTPGNLPSIVNLPTSKSYANRALILSALKPHTVTLENVPDADDVLFLIKALKEIGLDIHIDNEKVEVRNNFPDCEKNAEVYLEVGEGGTTARFLACMLLLGKSKYILKLGKRLKERPWGEFIKVANELGAHCSLNGEELSIQGPVIVNEKLEVDCGQTTQFASGFQLAFALKKIAVLPKNLNSSQSYWKMSQGLIDHFQSNRNYSIPLDWSSASYPMAFAALKHEIFFPKLHRDSFQADEKFFDILNTFGCIQEASNGVRITQITDRNKDVSVDVSDCLDLVPTLAFFLAHIEGTHILKNIDNLIHKESDRLNEIIKIIHAFGFHTKTVGSDLVIEGSINVFGKKMDLILPDDHRIVMCASLFMRYHQGGSVDPKEAVKKSYPKFFELLR